ncbi:kinase-like protein, partial [Phaeosphaeriaceae sp. SRC1lsM3a]
MSEAVHKKLAEHGLTHFEYNTTTDNRTSPFITIEKIGHGGFAAVESVEVKGAVYARKVMILPRHKEKHLKEMISNEVSVMKALDDHHHTVKVFCTYQEKRQFSIVLEPLATADLETYLYQPNADPLHLSPTIERWMRCLANTLAYLHRQGIRHKDVKTKNILVKGDQVYFSDFGSSRAFTHDSATSTEGPAFGNTRMYSAPEVIAEQRRNELSDVFSLGCVFSEMVTVL